MNPNKKILAPNGWPRESVGSLAHWTGNPVMPTGKPDWSYRKGRRTTKRAALLSGL